MQGRNSYDPEETHFGLNEIEYLLTTLDIADAPITLGFSGQMLYCWHEGTSGLHVFHGRPIRYRHETYQGFPV